MDEKIYTLNSEDGYDNNVSQKINQDREIDGDGVGQVFLDTEIGPWDEKIQIIEILSVSEWEDGYNNNIYSMMDTGYGQNNEWEDNKDNNGMTRVYLSKNDSDEENVEKEKYQYFNFKLSEK
ncbi:hypothetical protein BYT27DRAFT_7210472 [Phlegmacium glaucopus]|nr:hypothetical protein BYT27DRAFT_7210472 [Phlegmacium glaucopus]